MHQKGRAMSRVSVCALIVLAGVAVAAADVSEYIFHFQAIDHETGLVLGDYAVPSAGAWNPAQNAWEWSLDAEVDVMPFSPDDPVEPLATLLPTDGQGNTTSVRVQMPAPGSRQDPKVQLNFVMIAGAGPGMTEFLLTSPLYTFDALVDPQAKAEIGINVTDTDNDGALLTPRAGNTGTSLSYYNGAMPGTGDIFAEILTEDIAAAPLAVAAGSDDTGWQTINDTVSSISAAIHFDLSANDLASGASTYQVVPEPAGLVLFAALALVRRRS